MTQGCGVQAARSFGPAADLYDRARPGYDEAAVRFALPERVGRLLDLGAGSGKLTAAMPDAWAAGSSGSSFRLAAA
jgi:hypothetical protein